MSETQPSHTIAHGLVLVADDEPAFQLIITRVLLKLDLVPVLANDGVAAITAVQTYRSVLLCAILDIEMPTMNGIDAAHRIQGIAPDLSVILMSSLDPTNYAARILHLRLAGTLQKPFPLAALRVLIGRAMVGEGAHDTSVEQADVPFNTSVDASYG